jgi:hypothetical protein
MTEPPLFGPSTGSGPSSQGDAPQGDAPVPPPDQQPPYPPLAPFGDPASPVAPPPPGPGAAFTPPAEAAPLSWTPPDPTPGATSGPPPGPTPPGPTPPGPLDWSSPSPAYNPVPTGSPKSGGSRGTAIAVILVAVVVAAAGAIGAVALMGSSGPSAGPGGSAAATPVGVVVFTDDFKDPASGWATDTLPSGTTYKYTSNGFEVHAVGALHHIAPAPHGRERQRIAVSTTATQSSPAPDAAGFGVTCDRGTDAEELRYEFIAFADGTWSIERLDGPLSTSGDAPNVLKSGSLPTKPGSVPMTVEGSCISAAGGVTTQLGLSINGVKVTDLSDTATTLAGAGWYAELLVSSDDPATTVIVTKFEVRTLP